MQVVTCRSPCFCESGFNPTMFSQTECLLPVKCDFFTFPLFLRQPKVPPNAVPCHPAAFQGAFWARVGRQESHTLWVETDPSAPLDPSFPEKACPCYYLPEVLFRKMVAIRSFHGSWKSVSWTKLKGERGGVHFRKAFRLGGLGAAHIQDWGVKNQHLIIACKYSIILCLWTGRCEAICTSFSDSRAGFLCFTSSVWTACDINI